MYFTPFSVKIVQPNAKGFKKESYVVLAMNHFESKTLLLLADDEGNLMWMESGYCKYPL